MIEALRSAGHGSARIDNKAPANTLPLPAEILTQLFSLLPISSRVKFAETNRFLLFLFYTSAVLKDPLVAKSFWQLGGLHKIIEIIVHFPTSIKDEYVPCTSKGGEYLNDLGIDGPLTREKITNGLSIEAAVAHRAVVLTNALDALNRMNRQDLAERFKKSADDLLNRSICRSDRAIFGGAVKYVLDGSITLEQWIHLPVDARLNLMTVEIHLHVDSRKLSINDVMNLTYQPRREFNKT